MPRATTQKHEEPATEGAQFLVRATAEDGRVVLFERDSVHPDGEAFIVSDGREVLVGESYGVQQALAAGTIERV